MSGGGNKKKPAKAQGWEEAGAEFYQETFPCNDADLDVFQRGDPKHLATLLPSKQNRAATMKFRTSDSRSRTRTKTMRRKDCTNTTQRRASAVTTTADVQVSMLPDLSQNLSNEQSTWEEIMQMKALPLPMEQKRQMKRKILNEPNLRLQGYEQFKWRRRLLCDRISAWASEWAAKLDLWHTDMKTVEGRFGAGVMAYFKFVKWLFLLNVFICIVVTLFIVIPGVASPPPVCPASVGGMTSIAAMEPFTSNHTLWTSVAVDIVQGTGFMQCTPLFYGYYHHSQWGSQAPVRPFERYNLPMAYLLATVFYLLVVFVCIGRDAAHGLRQRLVESEGHMYKYANLVLAGWDYCIRNGRAARIKQNAFFVALKTELSKDRKQQMRSLNHGFNGNGSKHSLTSIRLFALRLFINLVVVLVQLIAACVIYLVFDYTKLWQTQNCNEDTDLTADIDDWTLLSRLLVEFAPSMTIVTVNTIVPFVFRYLVNIERLTEVNVVRITLLRCVFLRMASLVVACLSLQRKITPMSEGCALHGSMECWETYVGQQLYKLVLVDVLMHILVTFFVNCPRAMLLRGRKGDEEILLTDSESLEENTMKSRNGAANKCVEFVALQTFDLPKHVLDVVYLQTVCWLGGFFAPILSYVAVLVFFVLFYVKKFTCLVNCRPSGIMYGVSRSKSMFMSVLLVAFIFAVGPLVYVWTEMKPSTGCGPFAHNQASIWHTMIMWYESGMPHWVRSIVYFTSTAGFAVPLIVILLLALYYYKTVNGANRRMVDVLKSQLILEGHDKQFLLERLSKFVRHQQEQEKKLRQQRERQRERELEQRELQLQAERQVAST